MLISNFNGSICFLTNLGKSTEHLDKVLTAIDKDGSFISDMWGATSKYSVDRPCVLMAIMSDYYGQDCLLPTFKEHGFEVVLRENIPNPVHSNKTLLTTVFKVYK
jgi:hypothetical protein